MHKKYTPYSLCALLALLLLLPLCLLALLLLRTPTETSAKDSLGGTEGTDRVILLDPGHGGEDAGAIAASGALEKDLNLQTALLLRDLLVAMGREVRLTRSTDVLLYDPQSDYVGHKKEQDLATRLRMAQEAPDALFVSIHMNAYPESRYRGLQVWYSPNDPSSALYALGVQEKVREHLQPENTRRVKRADGGIYLMEHVSSPALLIECGFLSNPEEAACLCDPAYRQQLALLIALSLVECTENAP